MHWLWWWSPRKKGHSGSAWTSSRSTRVCSERSTHFRRWTRRWPNYRGQSCSASWTPTTVFGRYHWLKPPNRSQPSSLPLDASTSRKYHSESAGAPKHFQKRMTTILSGLDGVLCLIDDVLIFGPDEKEHDERLNKVLTEPGPANTTAPTTSEQTLHMALGSRAGPSLRRSEIGTDQVYCFCTLQSPCSN